MKNKIDQLVKAMIALEEREDSVQKTVVTENVIPPQVNGQTQSQPIRIPVENPVIQENLIIRDKHLSPHDVVEYHSFAFSEPNSPGEIPMKRIKDPRVVEIVKKYRMLNERLKAIKGCDAFDMDALNMCLVLVLVIPLKFKVSDF